MRKHFQKGFTLIELMIVVAIIGILAAIAIPAYQNYTIRAQVSEGATLADGVKVAMADYFANKGTWPTAIVGAGATSLGFGGAVSGNYVASVSTGASTGDVNVLYGNRANVAIVGKVLSIYAALSPNQDIVWICGKQGLPGAAVSVGGAAATTTVAPQYLPRSCQV
jgi:type IV pilus assembly protein PilA